MRVTCFSSFTVAYMSRARVLFASLRRHHPDWHLVALITDRLPETPGIDLSDEPFDEIVVSDALDIADFPAWIFKHDLIEACTAVKGVYLERILGRSADAVVYLDPDVCVFASLNPVLWLLDKHDIVLTPHQLAPDSTLLAIMDNEMCSLSTGIYNLGFIAVRARASGLSFASWWKDRLLRFCYDDRHRGLFVDQRWCDHVPALFDGVVILRDPGYNVASWNLSQRRVAFDEHGVIRVNGSPLRFWHFSKLGPVGDMMTRRYAGDNHEVHEIWRWYRHEVQRASRPDLDASRWAYGELTDGTEIRPHWRALYRRRADLQMAFPDPFSAAPEGYAHWLRAEGLLETERPI